MIRRFFLMAIISVSAVSCSNGEDVELEFKFQNSKAMLIPGETSSCTQLLQNGNASKDISAKYFQIIRPSLIWKGENSLQVFAIQIVMRGNGIQSGSYNCTIAGDELSYVFGTSGSPWAGNLAPGSSITSTDCLGIRCGGVDTVGNVPVSVTATIKIDAAATDSSGDQYPVRATSTIAIEGLAD